MYPITLKALINIGYDRTSRKRSKCHLQRAVKFFKHCLETREHGTRHPTIAPPVRLDAREPPKPPRPAEPSARIAPRHRTPTIQDR
jgi:hypothetical protein